MDGLDLSNIPFDLIINILNIAVFYLIIRCLVYKPVKKFLSARKEKLAQEQEALKAAEAEAEGEKAKYEALLAESEKQSRELLSKSREEADRKAAEILDAARADAAKMLADANAGIAAREKEALGTMQDDVVELSVNIASKLISRNIDSEDNRRLASDFFEKELGGMRRG